MSPWGAGQHLAMLPQRQGTNPSKPPCDVPHDGTHLPGVHAQLSSSSL